MDKSGDTVTLTEVDESMRPIVSYIGVGKDVDLEQQLIEKSRQPHIMKDTPKDHESRFGNHEMLQEWLTKNRTIHWLIGPDKDLAGIIWYGKKELPVAVEEPVPDETFAIRLYEGYVGKGLAKPFMRQSLRMLAAAKDAKQEKLTGIWLQTDIGNDAAYAAYYKFGYQEVHRDEARVTMVLQPEQIREIA